MAQDNTLTKKLDMVSFISIEYYADGSLKTHGNIGDLQHALFLLKNAEDAIRGQLKKKDEIIIPSRDVYAPQSPDFPTRPYGDMKPEDRGDMPR